MEILLNKYYTFLILLKWDLHDHRVPITLHHRHAYISQFLAFLHDLPNEFCLVVISVIGQKRDYHQLYIP